ncbi:MAG: DUF3817 domain-containing protein [Gammaproteobacteria bacterium]|nr:DUF3817 domain-containing protein [Gammaproteobacteria bacterium]
MKLFRAVSLIEGCSFLLLLFIAMPMKYYFGMPEAVSLAGMVHGILFVVYTMLSLSLAQKYGWSTGEWSVVLIAGMLPFGFLMIDGRLKRAGKAELVTDAA